MGKKKKTVFALAEDFQAIIAMIPKLESFIKAHEEIRLGIRSIGKTAVRRFPESRSMWAARS